jgi:hypothetical protein
MCASRRAVIRWLGFHRERYAAQNVAAVVAVFLPALGGAFRSPAGRVVDHSGRWSAWEAPPYEQCRTMPAPPPAAGALWAAVVCRCWLFGPSCRRHHLYHRHISLSSWYSCALEYHNDSRWLRPTDPSPHPAGGVSRGLSGGRAVILLLRHYLGRLVGRSSSGLFYRRYRSTFPSRGA